jgi:hypothetical protein
MWEWYVSNVVTLEQFHPIQYERIIEAIIPVCGIGKEKQVRAFFDGYMRQKTKAKDVIKIPEDSCQMPPKFPVRLHQGITVPLKNTNPASRRRHSPIIFP